MISHRTTIGLAVAGLGLILLGTAGILYARSGQADPALQSTDFSAIPVIVRYPAPGLSLTALDGLKGTLSDYKGDVVLVNLWATWCPPCQAEMPLLETFFQEHRAAGFTVVAIEDGEPAGDVRSFVAKYGLTFPIWLDPTHEAADHAFKTMNLPTSFVIDRSGTVRLTWLGAISGSNLEKYVKPLIEENQ